MLGFDDKALVLFPYAENCNSKGYQYKYSMKQAVAGLCRYLKGIDIAPHVFYTDDVARDLNHEDFVWVSTLGRADSFFATKYCAGLEDALTRPTVTFEDIYNTVTAKDPGSVDMSPGERFEMVSRHNNKAIAKIIPTYKIVIHFKFKNKQQYRVASKAGDGKIRINVDANTFIPTCYIGGIETDSCDLLNVNFGNRSLEVWP